MKVIVIGCGRTGAELAYRLSKSGHQVSVIDNDGEAFTKLPSDFIGLTNEGDALNRDVLRRAGAEKAEGLAAVTGSDAMNAVLGHLARTYYHIPHIVVRNYEPGYRHLIESFNLQLVSGSSWGAQRMEELLYHEDVRVVFSAGNGEVEIYEVTVPKNCEGAMLDELLSAGSCIAISLTRAGRAVLPGKNIKVEAGDVLLVSATMEGVSALRSRLCEPVKES